MNNNTITVGDLFSFMNERCVKSKSSMSFNAFAEAFRQWLPVDKRILVERNELYELMSKQSRYVVDDDNVRGIAIPGTQREMVSS
jgi:hypothetical protein